MAPPLGGVRSLSKECGSTSHGVQLRDMRTLHSFLTICDVVVFKKVLKIVIFRKILDGDPRLRTKVRGLVLNAIAFKTEPNTVVRALKLVRGDSDIRGVVVKIVRVLKFVRIRILKIQKSGV